MYSDPWDLYCSTRDRLVSLCRSLDADGVKTPVPTCPGWTVGDVVRHVCGLNADLAEGMLEGLGSDENTARQVETRRESSIDDVCAEWLGHAERVGHIMTQRPDLAVRLGGDLVIHLQDVQHALGMEIDRDDEATVVSARRYVSLLQERAAVLDFNVVVTLAGVGSFVGTGTSRLVLASTPYDFLRSISGRRSRRQVEALDWDGDPTAVLDGAWSPYGDLPADDVSA